MIKRELSKVVGYIPLKNTDPADLAKRYYELERDYQIFTHTQLVFKTIFWNTELQYSNHYLIALTRHDVAAVANATLMGFQAHGSEVALLRQFSIDNRIALDAVTAAQGGVCAIVGDGCCTYLPSESEGLGNLSMAIANIRKIQEGIVKTNWDAQATGGYQKSEAWKSISNCFSGNPSIAWILGIAGPLIVVILIIAVIMCCCFPLFRALILKSVYSLTNMTMIQHPVENVTIYASPERESSDSTSISSDSSLESRDNVD